MTERLAGSIVNRVRRRWATWTLRRAKKRLPGYKPVRDANDPDTWFCEHAYRIEDRRTYGQAPGQDWYLCVVCSKCRAIRCGHRNEENPCVRVRHHGTDHVYADGTREPLGGYRHAR